MYVVLCGHIHIHTTNQHFFLSSHHYCLLLITTAGVAVSGIIIQVSTFLAIILFYKVVL